MSDFDYDYKKDKNGLGFKSSGKKPEQPKPAAEQQAEPEQEFSRLNAMMDSAPTRNKGFRGAIKDTALSLGIGTAGISEIPVGAADVVTGGKVGKYIDEKGLDFGQKVQQDLADRQSDRYKEQQQEFAEAGSDGSFGERVYEKAKYAVKNPSLVVNTVAQSIPDIIVGQKIARALPKGMSSEMRGAAGEGITAAAHNIEDIRRETDDQELTGKQIGYGAATGLAVSLFGWGGNKLSTKLGIGDIDTMFLEGFGVDDIARNMSTLPAKSLPKAILHGAISEGFLEELPQGVSEQILSNLALDKEWSEGVDDALVMGTLAGMLMGASVGGTSAMVNRQGNNPDPEIEGFEDTPPPPNFDAGGFEGEAPIAGDDYAGFAPPPVDDQFRTETPRRPSEEAGLDPNNGPLSAAAALAYDQSHKLEQKPYEGEYMAAGEQEQPSGLIGGVPDTYTLDPWGNVIDANGQPVQNQNNNPQLGFNPDRRPAPVYEVDPDGEARPTSGEAAASQKERVDLSSLNRKPQAQRPRQEAEQQDPAETAKNAWNSMSTIERNKVAAEALGRQGVLAKNTASKAWDKLSEEDRASLTESISEEIKGSWVDTNRINVDTKAPVLQNRDRSTAEMINQMRSISNNPNYNRISVGRDFGTGAPVVTQDSASISPEQLGKQDAAVTATGKEIPVQYAVVEAEQLLASNNANGQANEGYDVGVEGKMRAIAGNGRTAGIQAAWEKGKAGDYKQKMIADAENIGVDPSVIEGMSKPVLVRIMPQEHVTNNIGDESNIPQQAGQTALEKSKNDMRRLDLTTLEFNENGEITTDTLISFIKEMPANEHSDLIVNGLPTQLASSRLKAAIFQQAYGQDHLTELQASSMDNEARIIISGLEQAAPSMAKLSDAGEYDFREAVAKAASVAVTARNKGVPLDQYLLQGDQEKRSEEVDAILNMMADNSRSAKRTAEKLKSLADYAFKEASKSSTDMLGEVTKATPMQIIELAFDGKQADLTQNATSSEPQGETAPINATPQGETTKDSTDTGGESWRNNYIQAAKKARELGIDPKKYKALTDLNKAIDAATSNAQQQSEGFDLAQQSEAELKEQEEAKIRREMTEREEQEKAEAERKQQEIEAFVKSQNEAAAANFELGQSAEDNLTGQQDVFSQPKPEPKAKPEVSENKVFTEDAAEKARQLLKSKLGQLNSGLDPEVILAGITLSGYHIEKGARTFAAYASAMVGDLGNVVKPYLKSWYMGVKYDPRAANFDGMEGEAEVNSFDLDSLTAESLGQQATEPTETATEATEKTPTDLADLLYELAVNGELPKDNRGLRKIVSDFDGQEANNARLKEAQEQLEYAMARYTRQYLDNSKATPAENYSHLVDIYNAMPLLNIRTSTSVNNQAYSTPPPMAYMVSRLAGIDKNSKVYEPTAGNGMLLVAANPSNVIANELEQQRFNNLKEQGFKTFQGDAVTAIQDGKVKEKSQDSVIANPPFASIKDSSGKATKIDLDGYKIGQIDHQITAEALRTMKDDGKAAVIIAANKEAGGISNDDRLFFNWLYSNYNVTGHFEADGKLYNRQGANWPVRVITIDGRVKSDKIGPLKDTIKRYDNWSDLYEQAENILDAKGRGLQSPTDGGEQSKPENDPAATQNVDGGQAGSIDEGGREGAIQEGDGVRIGVEPDSPREPEQLGGYDNEQRLNDGGTGADRLGEESQRDGEDAPTADLRGADARKPTRKPVEKPKDDAALKSDEFQSEYTPTSSKKDKNVLLPVNMKDAMEKAMQELVDAVGDLDAYVMKELGYESQEALDKALMGLQVDSIAAAIYQMKEGKGIIIADQTGIGKGRQAAAIIRWAERNGRLPVFMTAKSSLFTDMYNDLHDIGTDNINPFIVNANGGITAKEDGKTKLFKNNQKTHGELLKGLANKGALPNDRNAIFLTYSQINKPNTQRRVLRKMADNAIFILDESHEAGGDSATGEFVREILQEAKGVTYLSATYAKRPDNMPLYFKTDIGMAIDDVDSLIEAMKVGGLPLQTIVSNGLVRTGQMFRRERSFEGIDIETYADESEGTVKAQEEISDKVTSALRLIVEADALFHDEAVKEVEQNIIAAGGRVKASGGNKASHTVGHTQFTNIVHNFIRQMLLGIKAETAAQQVIEAIKRNEKPIIALENTMGSFLNEYANGLGLKDGDNLGNYDYRTVLTRALDRTRSINVEDSKGNKTSITPEVHQLPPQTRQAYRKAQELIDSLDIDIPVSPLDWIKHRVREAGYSMEEITGRSQTVDYSGDQMTLSTLSRQEQNDKVETIRKFNSFETDSLIINVAGATGINLHSSVHFPDQRKRTMIVVQAPQDINVFMQMLGRVHRTGQKVPPSYKLLTTLLPSEKRPNAMLNGKMKSLNANTSSNTESATSIKTPDMLNMYGDQIINAYLDENPDLASQLRVDVKDTGDLDGVAAKATGRMALMPVEVQKRFYDDVEAQYESLLEYLNETNQNELDAKTFDYEAVLTGEVQFTPETHNRSAFGAESVYGEYQVKQQGRPMTPEQIEAEIEKNLDGEESGKRFASAFIKKYKDLAPLNQDKGITGYNQKGINLVNDYTIGSMWRLEIAGENYNAIVTNVKNTHKKSGDPFSPSKIQIQFAVNSGLRNMTIPASQVDGVTVAPLYNVPIASAFREVAETTETVKIVTGNLLKAFMELKEAKGKVISFTHKDGRVEQGILLPKKFTLKDNARGDYKLNDSKEVLKYFEESNDPNSQRFGVSSRDAAIRILPTGNGVMVQVPKSRAKGGTYYLDESLINLAGDEFVSEGSFMRLQVASSRAAKVIDYLMTKKPLYVLPSQAEDAAEIVGRPMPKLEVTTTEEGEAMKQEQKQKEKERTEKRYEYLAGDRPLDEADRVPEPKASSESVDGSVTKLTSWDGKHTKTGKTLYMVKPNEKLDREQYNEVKNLVSKHDGFWDRYTKGFRFNSSEDRQAFLDDFNEAPLFSRTTNKVSRSDIASLQKRLEQDFGLNSLFLSLNERQGTLSVDNFVVPKEGRKEGTGSLVMNEITNFADEHGLMVTLSPALQDDMQGTTSRGRLVNFYKRFGFVENKGRNKDFTISAGMYRAPNDQMFSRDNGRNKQGMDKEAVENIASRLLGGKNKRVHIEQSYGDLPDGVRKAIEAEGAKEGDFSAVHLRGNSYLVADAFANKKEVEAAIFHEHYTHGGLRTLYGKDLAPKLDDMLFKSGGIVGVRMQAKKQGIDLSAYERALADNPNISAENKKRILMEELLAHMAHTTGTLRRRLEEVIGAIRQWLRDNGFAELAKLRTSDIAYTLKQAREAQMAKDSTSLPTFVNTSVINEREQAYETDLFGDPIPNTGRNNKRTEAKRGGRNVQPTRELRDTPAPDGEYIRRTILGVEKHKTIPVSKISSFGELATASRGLYDSAVERLEAYVTDKNGKVLGVVGNFKGAISQASVYMDVVLFEALRLEGAKSIWITHNHPSGTSELSSADMGITRQFNSMLDGTGLDVQGIIAVGQDEYSAFSANDRNVELDNFQKSIPDASGKSSVPVIERQLERHSGRVESVTSPTLALKISEALYKQSGNKSGILFLDNQHYPVAYVPVTEAMKGILRQDNGGALSIYRAASESNASAAIIVHDGDLDIEISDTRTSIASNLASAVTNIQMRALDIINVKTGKSEAQTGLVIGRKPMLSRRQSTAPAVDTPAFKRWFGDSKVVDADDAQILFHNSNNPDPFVVHAGYKNGYFDGIFAGPNGGMSGKYKHVFVVSKKNTLTHYEFSYDVPYADYAAAVKQLHPEWSDEQIERAWDFVAEDESIFDSDPSKYEDLFGSNEEGEADWNAQGLRGAVARILGFSAVEMNDETGVSTQVLAGARSMVIPANESFNEAEGRIFEQIKSAIGNIGSFDGTNPDIRFSRLKNSYVYSSQDKAPENNPNLERTIFNAEEREAWRSSNKVSQRQERTPAVQFAAQQLQNGEITQSEYISIVRKEMPIKPFKKVPKIPTLLDVGFAIDESKAATGIVGINKTIDNGKRVGLRLDIPAYDNYDTWVVSIHDGDKRGGKSIGYAQTGYIAGVEFFTAPKGALNIATGKTNKSTIARMHGDWINHDPQVLAKKAEEALSSDEWVEVGMNPFRHSWFYDKADGQPVVAADEVIQIGALVLARNVQKASVTDDQFTVGRDSDIRFSRTTRAAERVMAQADEVLDRADKWLDKERAIPSNWTAAQKKAASKFDTFSPRQPIASRISKIKQASGDKLAQKLFDQFRPLKKLSDKGFMQAHLSRGTDGALEAIATLGVPYLKDGAIAVKTNDNGFIGSLSKLGDIEEVNKFLMWVAANRAEGLMEEGRENLFDEEDIAAMKQFATGTLANGKPRRIAYGDTLKQLNEYNKAILDIAQEAGLVNAESRTGWESEFYIPFYRVMQEEDGSLSNKFGYDSGGLVRQEVIKRLKGGTENLGDPLENIMNNWSNMLAASMRNMASTESLEQAATLGISEELESGGDTWTMTNGQRRYWNVHDPSVLEALEALNFNGYNNGVMKAAGAFKRALTIGVTISPTFRIRNLIRDTLHAMAVTDAGYNPLANAIDGWKLSSKGSESMAQLMAGGGAIRLGSFTDGQAGDYVKRSIKNGIKDGQILNTPEKFQRAIANFYKGYQELGDKSETVNRAVIYRNVLEKTGSHLEASFAARDVMNFTSMGSAAIVRAMAQVLPFFNARLQGMYKLGRGANENPQRFMGVIGTIGMASALLYLMQADDDEYKQMPDYVRQTYWPIKLGDTWVYIPKPFEVGAMASVIEHFTELVTTGGDYDASDFKDSVVSLLINNLELNPVPQIILPAAEAWYNYDMFRQMPIDSMAMERLLPADRFDSRTSAGAVAAGRVLNASPKKVEHLVRGYFGWLGTQALNVSDVLGRGMMDMPSSTKWDMAQKNNWFIAGDFLKDKGTTPSKYTDRFYAVQRDINQIYATANAARRVGDIDRYRELMDDPKMEARPMIASATNRINMVNKQIRAINARKDLSAADKNERLKALYDRREAIARSVDEKSRM